LKIPGGQHVRRLQWKQGLVFRQIDLQTGQATATKRPVGGGVEAGVTPRQTLKVIGFQKKPPKNREFDMGATRGFVEGRVRITFKRSRKGTFT